MPIAQLNGIALDYELHGAADAPALLAIMGLGMPAAAWPPPLIERLVARGARVIAFDNRDAGGSTRLPGRRTIALPRAILRALLRLRVPAPYTLHDMAGDCVDLLDALGIERAHVMGVSMGGMIGQLVAARYPGRVASLVSIMSSTGNPRPRFAIGKPRALRAILSRPADPNDLRAVIDRLEHVFGVIGSASQAQNPEALRAHLERIARRGLDTAASRRQLLAVLATGDRRAWLARITAPTLVIHGRDDPLVPLAAGIETAHCIAGARLSIVDGMAHDLPPALLPRLADEIAEHIGLPAGRPAAKPP